VAAVINEIIEGSLAARARINPGECLVTINGEPINDILDYQFASTDERLDIEISNLQSGTRHIIINKELDDDLGIVFADAVFDGMMKCQNRCQFCFVDQMPKRMRRSLYVKDDDYRFSFLFGSFITLGNLRKQDWEKIEKYHLSPLYVSVHATDPEVHQTLVRPRSQPNIISDLHRLADMGIEMHTQIVLCPGLNDGIVLERTINDLASLKPWVKSVGIVPVGLTGFRHKLPQLRPVDKNLAAIIVKQGQAWQDKFRQLSMGTDGFVYLADEFFIKAGLPFPREDYYDGYPQIENGIGLSRQFLSGWELIIDQLPVKTAVSRDYIIICGISAVPVLSIVAERLNQIENLQVHLLPVENKYFGGQVTVTGLLTGQDIIASLKVWGQPGTVLLPRVVFKEGDNRLLDEVTAQDIELATGFEVKIVEPEAIELMQALELWSPKNRRARPALKRRKL